MGVGRLHYINRWRGRCVGVTFAFVWGESDTSICSCVRGLMSAFNLNANSRFRCEGVVLRRCAVLRSFIRNSARRRRWLLHLVSGWVVLEFHRCEYARVGFKTQQVMGYRFSCAPTCVSVSLGVSDPVRVLAAEAAACTSCAAGSYSSSTGATIPA